MNKLLTLLKVAVLTVALVSCKQKDMTPVYIHITPEDFENCIDVSNFNETHNQNFDPEQLQALTRHTFTHANVYVNNRNLGCWELPCDVPVLDVDDADSCTLILIPGFKMTGMSNTISGYPFLNILRQKVLFQKGKTYNVSQNRPKYVYSEYAQFPFFETFANSTSFKPTDTIQHSMTFEPVSFDGKNVGKITLNDANGLSFDVESPQITTPIGSYRVLLEVRYRTESNIDVGIKMSTGHNPYQVHSIGGFYGSKGEWKTIHFDLTPTLNSYHQASSGNVTGMTIVLSGIGDKGKDTNFYIDDIKVVYIKTA